MIVGTNIGAGVFPSPTPPARPASAAAVHWCCGKPDHHPPCRYVAESTLRTRAHLQLSGLAKRYVGGRVNDARFGVRRHERRSAEPPA